MKSNERPEIEARRREVLSKTLSLSLRLRFATARDGAPAFGLCSAYVRLLFGLLSGPRSVPQSSTRQLPLP